MQFVSFVTPVTPVARGGARRRGRSRAPGDGGYRVFTLGEPINEVMVWEIIISVWPLLAGLAYVLVTLVLLVCAMQYMHAIAIHDRVRESKALRAKYEELMRQRRDSSVEE